jgi:hypothetical protein
MRLLRGRDRKSALIHCFAMCALRDGRPSLRTLPLPDGNLHGPRAFSSCLFWICCKITFPSPLLEQQALIGLAVAENMAALIEDGFDFKSVSGPAALERRKGGRLKNKAVLLAE